MPVAAGRERGSCLSEVSHGRSRGTRHLALSLPPSPPWATSLRSQTLEKPSRWNGQPQGRRRCGAEWGLGPEGVGKRTDGCAQGRAKGLPAHVQRAGWICPRLLLASAVEGGGVSATLARSPRTWPLAERPEAERHRGGPRDPTPRASPSPARDPPAPSFPIGVTAAAPRRLAGSARGNAANVLCLRCSVEAGDAAAESTGSGTESSGSDPSSAM